MERYPVTFTLVLLLGTGFVLQQMYDGLIDGGAVTIYAPEEPYRLVTGTLLHAGIVHLVINAWILLQVGSVFELLFTSRRLTLVYSISAVAASLASCMWLDEQGMSVGASGAIFGVVGALLVMVGGASRATWAKTLHAQLAMWAVATLVLGFVSPLVDNAAHLGGLMSGAAVGVVFRLSPQRRAKRA